MTTNRKWDCSAVVFIEGDSVIAEDSYGNTVKEGTAGKDDAEVIQSAVDKTGPAGEVKICRGTYFFNKTALICNSCKICGEGRGTVIVPPSEDFAFRFMTTENTSIYRPYHVTPDPISAGKFQALDPRGDLLPRPQGPLYAGIFRNLTIDGEKEGVKRSGNTGQQAVNREHRCQWQPVLREFLLRNVMWFLDKFIIDSIYRFTLIVVLFMAATDKRFRGTVYFKGG